MTLPAQWIAATSCRRDPHMPLPLILADEPSMFRRIALASLDLSGTPYIERITPRHWPAFGCQSPLVLE